VVVASRWLLRSVGMVGAKFDEYDGNMALNGGYYKRGVGDPISVTLPLLATSII